MAWICTSMFVCYHSLLFRTVLFDWTQFLLQRDGFDPDASGGSQVVCFAWSERHGVNLPAPNFPVYVVIQDYPAWRKELFQMISRWYAFWIIFSLLLCKLIKGQFVKKKKKCSKTVKVAWSFLNYFFSFFFCYTNFFIFILHIPSLVINVWSSTICV